MAGKTENAVKHCFHSQIKEFNVGFLCLRREQFQILTESLRIRAET